MEMKGLNLRGTAVRILWPVGPCLISLFYWKPLRQFLSFIHRMGSMDNVTKFTGSVSQLGMWWVKQKWLILRISRVRVSSARSLRKRRFQLCVCSEYTQSETFIWYASCEGKIKLCGGSKKEPHNIILYIVTARWVIRKFKTFVND